MPQPRILILRAPGTNCDQETAYAFETAGGRTESLHVNRLLEEPNLLGDYQVLCLPGGFSYGDDIAAGRILGNRIGGHLAGRFRDFIDAGKLILGICNGFQILIKSGILLPTTDEGAAATLTWNESGKFEDRWVHVRPAGSNSIFFAGIERMYLPIAHAEGKFVTRDAQVLEQLEKNGQLALRYCTSQGEDCTAYPLNPNGSMASVAGLCDVTGRVCGLMPHPERHIDSTQHPHWTRHDPPPVGDGLRVFQNAVAYFG